jgi:hypothetical protein
MKDRLGKARFWNSPLKNPTQNAYDRFNKKPGGEWFDKGFRESEKEFRSTLNRMLKTRYSDFMDDL